MNTTPKIWELVSILILARHGKAVAAEGRPDAERELNELGQRQANALGFSIQPSGITSILSSPLRRVMETMRIATNGSGLSIRPVAELTCPDVPTDPIMIMWTELGNVPISSYFAHTLGNHLKIWGRTALSAIIRELQKDGPGQKVLVGGHALLQNALLWAIAEQVDNNMGSGWRNLYETAETTLGEGQAFVIRFNGKHAYPAKHLRPMET